MDRSKIEFGSLLTYTPRGTSYKAKEAKTTTMYLKNNWVIKSGDPFSEYIAQVIKKDIMKLPFKDYFAANTLLVPIPKSSLSKQDTLWVPERLTRALVKNGLGKASEPCLKRIKALPRSSGQTIGAKRPTAFQHYESMGVKKLLFEPDEIVLVDDVITRGATTMGGINRLAEVFPKAKIRAFAMMRTISNSEEFWNVIDPCVGTVTMRGEYIKRDP